MRLMKFMLQTVFLKQCLHCWNVTSPEIKSSYAIKYYIIIINRGGAVLKYNKTEAEAYEAYVRETEHPGNYVLMSAMSKPLSTEFLLLENADARVEELGIGTGQYMLKTVDYCRFATLELLTREIEKCHVPGAVAELGVFRGDFAKYINRLLPNRKFYLFDTFEGFDRKDIDTELHGQYSKQSWFDASLDYFSNTNVDKVLEKMKHREQCIVRKGYFPDTIPKEEVAYAFVSLDCDLYQPMLEGLRYFYPRLQKGGYLMIHDYNGDTEGNLTGVRKAVQDYEMESGEFLHKVPISDACGSLVICK